MKEVISGIARDILGIETLEVQGRDCLDFHDLNVVLIKDALEAAFAAGAAASQQKTFERA